MVEVVRHYKKSITADLIRGWWSKEVDSSPLSLSYWEDLRDDFGASLPFFIAPDKYVECPFASLGIPNIKLSNLSPSLGEACVLFCFINGVKGNGSPIRNDGFMLPLEWRKNTEHSHLLPKSLIKLAENVLLFFYQISSSLSTDAIKWGLHPSFQRFSDNYNFSDETLFGKNVGSAWGALAAGLQSALTGYVPAYWPFCSLQFDSQIESLKHVEGIKQKLSVAASYNCGEFVVAPCQVREANLSLAELKKTQLPGSKAIRIVPADSRPETMINSILYSHLEWLRPTTTFLAPQAEFYGRQWLIDKIMAEKTDHKTTIIYGLPGTGKSALLNKVAEIEGDDVLAFYVCSKQKTSELIKTIAYQIALKFPEAFSQAGIDNIRKLSLQDSDWVNLKKLYLAAVIEPMKFQNKFSKKPLSIIIDALDESLDLNVAKLISDAETQLPEGVSVIVASRQLQEIQQLLNRISLNVIDLDSRQNAQRSLNDLSEYIQHRLSQTEFVQHFKGQNRSYKLQIFETLQRNPINYRYLHYTFLNILNGIYAFDQLGSQLPKGVQGHYLAFFDSHISKNWDEIKPLLELLVASPVPLSRDFINSVLKSNPVSAEKMLNGYIVEQNKTLLLCDGAFREWLIDKDGNPAFFVNPKSGHDRLVEYGWPHFCKIISEMGESDISGKNIEMFKQALPMELQETIGHHIARSSFIISRNQQKYAAILLAMVKNPNDRAAITNSIQHEQKDSNEPNNTQSKKNEKSKIINIEHLASGVAGGIAVLSGGAIVGKLSENDHGLEESVRNDAPIPSNVLNTTDLEVGVSEFDHQKVSYPQDTSQEGGGTPVDEVSVDVLQKYPDTCAIRSQEIILRDFGLDVSEDELVALSIKNGWYTPGDGTKAEDVGELLKEFGVDVNVYKNANIFTLSNELAQNHRVIIGVDSGELWRKGVWEKLEDAIGFEHGDHALIVSGIDTSDEDNIKVILTDPGTGEVAKKYSADQFLDAWQDSGCLMVATKNPAPAWLSSSENFDYKSMHLSTFGSLDYEELEQANLKFSDNLFVESNSENRFSLIHDFLQEHLVKEITIDIDSKDEGSYEDDEFNIGDLTNDSIEVSLSDEIVESISDQHEFEEPIDECRIDETGDQGMINQIDIQDYFNGT